jgi:hypothetical protein
MFLAARYGERLAAFEIWNEPDQANEKFWAGPDKVARYVALVKATYGPLKRVNPGLQVLAGSFVGTDGRWLRAMYRAGIQGHYDGLAVHFYDLPLRALQTTHAVQVAHGDGKPLWLTEFGWTSCYRRGGPAIGRDHPCVTRALQGTALADVFRAVARTPWIAAAIVYTLHDEDADYRFGLLDRRGRRKPSFAAVRRALHSPLAPMTRPTLALRRAGRRVVVSGRGSLADVYLVEASVNGTLRYRAYVRTSRLGGWELTLPAALGTTGVRVTVTSDWTRASAARQL